MNKLQLDYKKMKEVCLTHISNLVPDGSAYSYIDKGSNILAVAHCDYIAHGEADFADYEYKGKHYILSETLDDRLGVYLITKVLPSLRIKTDILLTTDEEIGNSTAQEFVLPEGKKYNWIFSFDRRGNDIVAYDYEDADLIAKVKQATGQTLAIGSYSDIVYLEHLGVKGLNFGTGYFDEHTINCSASDQSIRRAVGTFQAFYNMFKNTTLPHDDSMSWRSYGYRSSYYPMDRDDGYQYEGGYSDRFLNNSGASSTVTLYKDCEYCGMRAKLEYFPPLESYMCKNCIDSIVVDTSYEPKEVEVKKGELVARKHPHQCEYCTSFDDETAPFYIKSAKITKNLCPFCKAYFRSHMNEPGFMDTIKWN